jgi:hypothetical protein
MFINFTDIKPKDINDIEFVTKTHNNGNKVSCLGKTIVTFRTPYHTLLAFDTLYNKIELCGSNRQQKRVNLKISGQYMFVRKMIWDHEEIKIRQEQQERQQHPQEQEQQN